MTGVIPDGEAAVSLLALGVEVPPPDYQAAHTLAVSYLTLKAGLTARGRERLGYHKLLHIFQDDKVWAEAQKNGFARRAWMELARLLDEK
jgi:hypothetical protein